MLHTRILLLLFWAFLSWALPAKSEKAAVGNNLDSLKTVLRSQQFEDCDEEKFRILNKIIKIHLRNSIDSALSYSQMLYDEAKRCGNSEYIMLGCDRLDDCHYYMCNFDLCQELSFEGLAIADSIGDKAKMALFYQSLGTSYGMTAQASLADEYWNKAYRLYAQLKDSSNMVRTMNNMAINALNNDMFDVADCYSDTTIMLSKKDKSKLAESYFIKGGCQMSRFGLYDNPEDIDMLRRSLDYFYLSRKLSQSANVAIDIAKCDIYIAQNYAEQAKYKPTQSKELLDSCKILLDESYNICINKGYMQLLDMYKNSRLEWLIRTEQFQLAQEYIDSLFCEYSADIENHGIEMEDTYLFYSELYASKKEYKKAYESHKLFCEWYRKNRQNDFAAKSATNMAQTRFDLQTQARELQYQAKTQRQRIIIVGSIIILLVLGYSFWKSKKANRLLDEKNSELEQQKEEVLTMNESLARQRDLFRKVNSQITDSINYASLIQNAALPSAQYLKEILGEHFVYYRPKDIVSGDFYWAHQRGNKTLLVVADCTGHGVPGGFISMLGMSLLSEIVARINIGLQNTTKEKEQTVTAGYLLGQLRTMLREALHQNGEAGENSDGMDLALVIIDNDTKNIHYAGAYRPIYIYHDGEMKKIEADRMHIGGNESADSPFTNHEIALDKGDMVYMFSDGIVDQFGYDDARGKEVKYTTHRLTALLNEINTLPCEQQSVRMQAAMDQWRRIGTELETEQTDDNIMVGIRI